MGRHKGASMAKKPTEPLFLNAEEKELYARIKSRMREQARQFFDRQSEIGRVPQTVIALYRAIHAQQSKDGTPNSPEAEKIRRLVNELDVWLAEKVTPVDVQQARIMSSQFWARAAGENAPTPPEQPIPEKVTKEDRSHVANQFIANMYEAVQVEAAHARGTTMYWER